MVLELLPKNGVSSKKPLGLKSLHTFFSWFLRIFTISINFFASSAMVPLVVYVPFFTSLLPLLGTQPTLWEGKKLRADVTEMLIHSNTLYTPLNAAEVLHSTPYQKIFLGISQDFIQSSDDLFIFVKNRLKSKISYLFSKKEKHPFFNARWARHCYFQLP